MSDARTTETWKTYDFLQKLKKVVWLALYGPAISQSDCKDRAQKWGLRISSTDWVTRVNRLLMASCWLSARKKLTGETIYHCHIKLSPYFLIVQ